MVVLPRVQRQGVPTCVVRDAASLRAKVVLIRLSACKAGAPGFEFSGTWSWEQLCLAVASFRMLWLLVLALSQPVKTCPRFGFGTEAVLRPPESFCDQHANPLSS